MQEGEVRFLYFVSDNLRPCVCIKSFDLANW